MGRTLDTNSNWIAKRVTSLGGRTSRVVVVDDDVPSIVREIETARSNQVRVIITTGGLGPTADDKTLVAVAEATDHPLTLDPHALDFVRSRYQFFRRKGFVDSDRMTPSRRKMAMIPEGSQFLRNSVGGAPGVHLEMGDFSIFSIPGVPREMRTIFEEEMVEILKAIFGKKVFVEKTITTPIKDESQLGDILNGVMKQIPRVYLKSRPTHFGKNVQIDVTLTASGDDRDEVAEQIRKAIRKIREKIGKDVRQN